MVTVTNVIVHHEDTPQEYVELELSDGVEFMQIRGDERIYAVLKHVAIPCIFGKEAARRFIGTELPGTIISEMVTDGPVMLPGSDKVLDGIYRYKFVPAELPIMMSESEQIPIIIHHPDWPDVKGKSTRDGR